MANAISSGLGWLLLVLIVGRPLEAASNLLVQAPENAKIASASATAARVKLSVTGKIDGRNITFANVLPDTPYDVQITLADGTVLQGADMGWYSPEPAKSDAQALDDDDRKQIDEIFNGVKAFENKRKMLDISGDHDRATVLAELIADYPFYGRKGDEVIWRVELWYFKNQHGGWERISQQNKVLRRVRFKSVADYRRATEKLKWAPELGGLVVAKDQTRTVKLAEPK